MPEKQTGPQKTIEQIAEELGLYPPEAFEFVQLGLQHTVEKMHGHGRGPGRHGSGRELSEGLREFAQMQWGYLARAVLRRWNITRTEDFGRIVFALVENAWMSKTDEDTLEDFRGVFDFASAFEEEYRIECKS